MFLSYPSGTYYAVRAFIDDCPRGPGCTRLFTVGHSSRFIQNALRLLSRVAYGAACLTESVYHDRLVQWKIESANAKRYTRKLSTRDATLIMRQFVGDETLKP
jgi:hypothetical protein